MATRSVYLERNSNGATALAARRIRGGMHIPAA